MKYSIFLILILYGCSRNEYSFSISGVLLDSCESSQPIVNAYIQLQVEGSAIAYTRTDAKGSFLIQGSWKKGPLSSYAGDCQLIWDHNPGGQGVAYQSLALIFESETDLGIIYGLRTQQYQIILNEVKGSYTDSDTLFLDFSNPERLGIPYQHNRFGQPYSLAYAGPFTEGRLDTLVLLAHSARYYHDRHSLSLAYWVNDAVIWGSDHSRDGIIVYSKSGYQEEDFSDCDTVLSMLIDL